MGARKRGPSKQPLPPAVESNPKSSESTTTSTEPQITLAKPSKILLFSLFRCLLCNPNDDSVASRYVIRRNLFGYNINKRGTPQGLIKVPESLGIVVGTVFLLVAILFQYFNFTSDSNIHLLL
ncbi:hypothetical protein L6452_40765 [Arctium lappa]|uniref:Uncharacterized protein n=1 Tax=Arctium lappa TaxID=4217 RepID=A0ACB8XS00_ARCLA|nr:hypothetical protein L6452_40765 [Arctium lappa]